MDQGRKTLDPAFPIMQQHCGLDPPCVVNTHAFQSTGPQFIPDFLSKVKSSSPDDVVRKKACSAVFFTQLQDYELPSHL